ncbi:MAG: type III pantothenate kinase [Dehalococcoidia bacterium]|nr:type III pantothenate kinase [Dehalococcoidia bacterium]
MLLVVDAGNTNIVLGLFDGDQMRAKWRVSTDSHRMSDEYGVLLMKLLPHRGLRLDQIEHAIIASVVPSLTTIFLEVLQRYCGVRALVVGAGIKTGLRLMVDNPGAVGADRVVDSVAAYRIYGGPVIVVDFGTATTFDVVSRTGDFLGGAIAPGILIAGEALFEKAAKLTRVELVRPKNVIGKNTMTAIQAGVLLGYVGLVEGIIDRIKRELGGSAKVIATGGLAALVAKETPAIDVVDEDLTLTGLRLVHELNSIIYAGR